MRKIIVIKDVLYASNGSTAITDIDNINTLMLGGVAVITETGVILTAAGVGTELLNIKRVAFAVGGVDSAGNKIARITPFIDRNSPNINVTKTTYVAPVKHAVIIGNDGSAGAMNVPTLTGSPQVAGIKVLDLSAGTQPPIRYKTYEEPVRSGDTALTVMLRMITRINADTDAFVVATDPSTTGAGTLLTASDYGVQLSIATYGVFEDADVYHDGTNAGVAIVYGTGTPAQVEAIWQECSTDLGNTNKVELKEFFFTATSGVDTAATYDIYWIESQTMHETPAGNTMGSNSSLGIAMPTAASTLTQTNFQTILAACFGTARTNFETGI